MTPPYFVGVALTKSQRGFLLSRIRCYSPATSYQQISMSWGSKMKLKKYAVLAAEVVGVGGLFVGANACTDSPAQVARHTKEMQVATCLAENGIGAQLMEMNPPTLYQNTDWVTNKKGERLVYKYHGDTGKVTHHVQMGEDLGEITPNEAQRGILNQFQKCLANSTPHKGEENRRQRPATVALFRGVAASRIFDKPRRVAPCPFIRKAVFEERLHHAHVAARRLRADSP